MKSNSVSDFDSETRNDRFLARGRSGASRICGPKQSSHPYTQVPGFMARHLRNIKED